MSDLNILHFLIACGKLKRTVRTGWKRHNVKNPESVAEHMYRMALISLLLPKTDDFDSDKVLKMAIVHDLAECIIGDITPYCGISVEEKRSKEKAAMHNLCANLPEELKSEILDLWQEYANNESSEAVLCKDLDRFEMILQAFEYEQEEEAGPTTGRLEEFFTSTRGKFASSPVVDWVKALYELRAKTSSSN